MILRRSKTAEIQSARWLPRSRNQLVLVIGEWNEGVDDWKQRENARQLDQNPAVLARTVAADGHPGARCGHLPVGAEQRRDRWLRQPCSSCPDQHPRQLHDSK